MSGLTFHFWGGRMFWSNVVSRRFAWITAAAFLAASAVIASNAFGQRSGRVSPSFDCLHSAVAAQPLAQIICSSEVLASTEFQYVMTFYAARHAASEQNRAALTTEADAFTRRVVAKCSLPTQGRLARAATDQEIDCIRLELTAERQRLFDSLSSEARAELTLKPIEAMQLQQLLMVATFLPADSTVDGKFGPITRGAITSWQRTNGLPGSGFASVALLEQLKSAYPSFHKLFQDADKGDASAMFGLAEMYRKGEGVPQSDREAVRWYRYAADLNHPSATNNLGYMYDKGRGIPKDLVAAAQLYEKAANLGQTDAMANIGLMYMDGIGVTRDQEAARRWLSKAADDGNETAKKTLEKMTTVKFLCCGEKEECEYGTGSRNGCMITRSDICSLIAINRHGRSIYMEKGGQWYEQKNAQWTGSSIVIRDDRHGTRGNRMTNTETVYLDNMTLRSSITTEFCLGGCSSNLIFYRKRCEPAGTITFR